jgi:hypothetical protein
MNFVILYRICVTNELIGLVCTDCRSCLLSSLMTYHHGIVFMNFVCVTNEHWYVWFVLIAGHFICLRSWLITMGSSSWIFSVSQRNTDMFGLYWLQVMSFVFAHDLSPCVTYDRLLASAASWMSLVEQDLIYHLKLLCLTPILIWFLLLTI